MNSRGWRDTFASGPFRAFRYPQFRLLWAASIFSVIPFFMNMAGRGWLVLEMTDSPFMVTAAHAVSMTPMMVVTPIGGVIADRLNRKTILIAGEITTCLSLLALAILLFTGKTEPWHVFGLGFINGVAFSTPMPARAAAVPDLVGQGDVAKGVAVYTIVFSVSQLVGPALAGYLLKLDPEQFGWTFLAAALFVAVAIALLMFLRLPPRAAGTEVSSRTTALSSLAEGLKFVRASNLLIGLLLMSMVFSVFGLPYQTILPVFARDILDSGPDGLGLLLAAGGAGAIVGSMVVAFVNRPAQMQAMIIGAGISFGAGVVLFSFSDVFLISLALSLYLGLTMQVFGVAAFAVLQVGAPAHMRGRVVSTLMLAWGMGPAGMFLLGFGAEVIDPEIALLVMGIIAMGLMAVVVAAVPALRHIDAELKGRQTSLLEEPVTSEAPGPADND